MRKQQLAIVHASREIYLEMKEGWNAIDMQINKS
jgi:hypothetical protein